MQILEHWISNLCLPTNLQVINYDTDLPAHYTLSATFNFHDIVLNDQEQAALRIIWNGCAPVCGLVTVLVPNAKFTAP